MPRPRRPGAPEPKRRSRKGCWPCKARKVKCGEEKPSCLNCRRQNEPCDYSIRLNWGGRTRRKSSVDSPSSQSSSPSGHYFSFALSPPNQPQSDPLSSAHSLRPLPTRDEIPVQDQTTGNLIWDIGLTGELAIGTSTSSPKGLQDIHRESPAAYGQSLKESNRTKEKTSVDMGALSQEQDVTASWPDLSSHIGTPSSNDTILAFSSVPHSSDGISYPSPADTNSSIGPFATFSFSPVPISRPISFLRHSSGQHRSPPEPLPDHRHDFSSYPSSNMTAVYADYNPQVASSVREVASPHSMEVGLHSSRAPHDLSTLQTSPVVPTQSFFNKIMNTPSPPDSQLDGPQSDGETAFHTSSSDLLESVDTSMSEKRWQAYLTSVTDNYGLDCGRPDLDLNKNDDHSAIDINYALDLISFEMTTHSPPSPGHQRTDNAADHSFDRRKHAYYSSPVPINIPRYLSPLPPSLVKTPINLMYFHHFLNHTARMLVPHDCRDNPFISVLPTMAIGDSDLLNLMLAYSASHRARYLGHPEPATRIAHWVSNVFPALRLALEGPHEKVTDNHLATAIMLLSLKIISPSTFEVPILWQSHLKLARDLFLARKEQIARPGNRVGAFLTRWLGYLDLMGALSCRQSGPPLLMYDSVLRACSPRGTHDEFCIDCFTGFTPRTGSFLTRLGRLVYRCDTERFDETGAFISDWEPSPDAIFEAEALMADLNTLDEHVHADATHFQDWGALDFLAIDRAFRCAGLLHLHRRVLNTSPCSEAVREASNELFNTMVDVRRGASAEVGALFPLFTAGCEIRDPQKRAEIQERFEILERTGMKQMQNARTLMQRCWAEDLPWIALAQGEFLG
ncbi:C6 zinc finger domain protein [Aspergillus heteromorphus CBS 117.55]|uniref:C6 zinc finger domain protein n=1 Tax=Aspergillus heteromorphus CBS 117.55 TaxID=1448321 RepID=A0A317WRX7_9EURO|nr:C6 zinc finger domain protein [Aspergillus heteromorphus CBS 117.55]PWY86930.1 C6 zinc finger domain protein [Aspergillus heteromorphus CBS 117.55]